MIEAHGLVNRTRGGTRSPSSGLPRPGTSSPASTTPPTPWRPGPASAWCACSWPSCTPSPGRCLTAGTP